VRSISRTLKRFASRLVQFGLFGLSGLFGCMRLTRWTRQTGPVPQPADPRSSRMPTYYSAASSKASPVLARNESVERTAACPCKSTKWAQHRNSRTREVSRLRHRSHSLGKTAHPARKDCPVSRSQANKNRSLYIFLVDIKLALGNNHHSSPVFLLGSSCRLRHPSSVFCCSVATRTSRVSSSTHSKMRP
jgi:hypothetical protein